MKIEELDLSLRTYNCLKRSRIDTVEQIQQLSDDDLLRFKCVGPKAIAEVRQKLREVRPQTNADRIRAMSDEELATMIMCPYGSDSEICGAPADLTCIKCCLTWLRRPAEQGGQHE